jgi:hypothetical protein
MFFFLRVKDMGGDVIRDYIPTLMAVSILNGSRLSSIV